MKRATIPVFFAYFLAVGCGLDTSGLGDLSPQAGSTGSHSADAGANVGSADASPASAADAQVADSAIAIDAASAATGCGASTCGSGAMCCAKDLGGGKTATSCAVDCTSGDAVVCDVGGSPCADGECAPSAKFVGLTVCH